MLLVVLVCVWLFFYLATNGTFLTQRNLVLLALADLDRQPGRDQRGDADRHPQFRSVGRLGGGAGRRHPGACSPSSTMCSRCRRAGRDRRRCAMGAWQGLWVTRVGVSSFIVTLAGMLYFRGISMIATNGATSRRCRGRLTGFATGFLPPLPSIMAVVVALALYAGLQTCRDPPCAGAGGRPTMRCSDLVRSLLPATVAALAAIWIASLAGHPLPGAAGRALRPRRRIRHAPHAVRRSSSTPIGGNPEAARLSGINVSRVIFWNFVIAGLGYGITGVALTRASAAPSAAAPACSSSSMPSPPQSSAAHRCPAAGGGSSARCSAPS